MSLQRPQKTSGWRLAVWQALRVAEERVVARQKLARERSRSTAETSPAVSQPSLLYFCLDADFVERIDTQVSEGSEVLRGQEYVRWLQHILGFLAEADPPRLGRCRPRETRGDAGVSDSRDRGMLRAKLVGSGDVGLRRLRDIRVLRQPC